MKIVDPPVVVWFSCTLVLSYCDLAFSGRRPSR
jgi:hypothetical protein